MAITKTDAQVKGMNVLADGSIEAKIIYSLSDDGSEITRVRTTLTVSDATDDEKTAAASLVSKASAAALI